MLRKLTPISAFLAVTIASAVFLSGCGQSQDKGTEAKGKSPAPQTDKKNAGSEKKGDEHGHKPGQHGGIMVEIGRDNYHAEALFEKGGMLKLYTLGKDESKVVDIESQIIKAYVKEEMGTEAVEMELNPVPRTGDKAGRTSQFIGKLPAELAGKQVTVTIPIIAIDGERFRIGFTSVPAKHDEGMPIGVSGADEKELYLKPGGIYTDADIKANGNRTASQKFKGVKAKHDLRPKAGEKICPITLTKANPDFTWIVAGKSYEFCCPPCVDEFVTMAKTQPDQIMEPDFYIKKQK